MGLQRKSFVLKDYEVKLSSSTQSSILNGKGLPNQTQMAKKFPPTNKESSSSLAIYFSWVPPCDLLRQLQERGWNNGLSELLLHLNCPIIDLFSWKHHNPKHKKSINSNAAGEGRLIRFTTSISCHLTVPLASGCLCNAGWYCVVCMWPCTASLHHRYYCPISTDPAGNVVVVDV